MLKVGQDIFVLQFEPDAAFDRLVVDKACPRTGPGVLLFADSIDLGLWESEPLEPQRALWTEVAVGYYCDARGAPATAFHFPFLMLSSEHGDLGQALADVVMTRFHSGCPGYDGPAQGRGLAASASTFAGVPLVDFQGEIKEELPGQLPRALVRWVNRLRYPDVNVPQGTLDGGLYFVEAQDVRVTDVWKGVGEATFHAGFGWTSIVRGDVWHYGTTYVIDQVEAL